MTILGFRLGTLLVACVVLSLIIVAVYRLGRPGKASELPPEERLRRLEALRKSLGLRTRPERRQHWNPPAAGHPLHGSRHRDITYSDTGRLRSRQ